MRFAVVANLRLEKAKEVAEKVVAMLEREHEVETPVLPRERVLSKGGGRGEPDVVITVGGDGTILSALQHYDAKVLGINLGEVGFLTEVVPDDLDTALERVVNGDFNIDKRIRIKGELNGQRLPDALNEAVLHTAQIAKLQEFSVSVDGERVMSMRADGVIVATPTGSTCYSMSAGGPIVDPRVEALIALPIAPYKLSARPLVVPATSTVMFEMARDKPCGLVLDGQHEVEMNLGDRFEATVSENPAEFIRFEDGFYSRVQKKLA